MYAAVDVHPFAALNGVGGVGGGRGESEGKKVNEQFGRYFNEERCLIRRQRRENSK